MADLNAIYRCTVYQPRPNEGSILAPAAGAAHSDDFKVATATGVSGFQPYMDIPRGRRGNINPITKKTDTGQLAIRILDARVTAGGTNLTRWVTAFHGDAEGRNRWNGLKVFVEESTDAGSSWSSFFTGRIEGVDLQERLWFQLVVRDNADDLDMDIFTSLPHGSATGPIPTCLIPNGLVEAYGDFQTIPYFSTKYNVVTGAGRGIFTILDNDSRRLYAYVTSAWPGTYRDGGRLVLPGQLPEHGGVKGIWVWCRIDSGGGARDGESGYMLWTGETESGGIFEALNAGGGKYRVWRIMTIELPSTHSEYFVRPPDNAYCSVYVMNNAAPTKELPLLINDVHPCQLWADMLDGYYSMLDPTTGSPLRTVAYNSTAMSALIADATIPDGRFIIDKKGKANKWSEDHICKVYNLGYYFNADGELVPLDLRLPTSVGGIPTLVNSDLNAEDPGDWGTSRASAISGIKAKYYVDNRIEQDDIKDSPDKLPTIPPYRIKSRDDYIHLIDFGGPALGERELLIDAIGYRASANEMHRHRSRIDWMKKNLRGVCEQLRGPYGRGAAVATFAFRRTTNVLNCWPGNWRIATLDPMPDPDDHDRGGSRLVLCLGREEAGPIIKLTLLDTALNIVSDDPTLGTLAQGTITEHEATMGVTLNGEDHAVHLEVAITDTDAGTRPAADSELWHFETRVTADGTATIRNLPSNSRIWLRGRSAPAEGDEMKLPSSWVFPTTPAAGYIDSAAITAPSGASVGSLTATTGILTWTNGDATYPIEILLKTGTAPASWVRADRIAIVMPGVTEYLLVGLDGPSAQHTVGVRHLDNYGGMSTVNNHTFSTTTTTPDCPRPAGLCEAITSNALVAD